MSSTNMPSLRDDARALQADARERARLLAARLPKPRLRGMLHLIAFPTALVAGLLLVALGSDLATRLACAVFVMTAGMLFGISATYHRGTWQPRHALLLRRFDHANIFLIIAGTYTPIAVALLPPDDASTLLAICWGGAAVGVAFRLFWTGAPRWLYVPAYVALGWVAVFYMPQLLAGGGPWVVGLIIAGGIAYTLGALVYALRRPDPSPLWFGFHEIFHTGTIAGFACHFTAVALAIS
ncbi:hemolysin III family protein [Brachybacterium sp. EF45031]|uniref:PAQR family membrane homeostasis protein TrhA n=1 Tax=Brachybacterium sillae TaxID=2810536 RepID=UPI00217F0518|nr:hemolysin III family protein [Brachybacterium sillae]MCS6711178.1 hemolysin III family protein [Brachybacterium sillae]